MKKKNKKNSEIPLKDKILSKFTTGRTKSHKKRKKTLLYEYKYRNKSNRFIDRRIGEKNRAMTVEDRLMARFAAERIKRHRKKEIYNLGEDDDVVLTHSGRELQDVEKFEDPRSDDDDDNTIDGGKLQGDYVSEAHFGGGLFSKVDNSRYNAIEDLISESKKHKAERQLTREHVSHLTDKLDKDLKNLLPLISDQQHADEKAATVSSKADAYDVTVNKLKFEAIGKPSERTKSAIEIEIEQNRKFKELEEERIKRMKRPVSDTLFDEQDEVTEPPPKKHQSADDLDDGFHYSSDDNDDDDEQEEQDESDDDDEDAEEDENDDSMEDDSDDGTIDNREKSDKSGVKPKRVKFNNVLLISNVSQPTEEEKFGNFNKMLHDKSLDEKVEAIKTIMKERHPSTGGSKQDFMEIFPLILRYNDELVAYSLKEYWLFAEKIYPFLFDLTQTCPDEAGLYVFDQLEEKQRTYNEQNRQCIPINVLPILKLVPLLFPTSDYYHPVSTPTVMFICQMLSQSPVDSLSDIAKGIFCTTILLEFIDLSKKYCPEAVCYLKRLLYCATPLKDDSVTKRNVLALSESYGSKEISVDNLILIVQDLEAENETDILKIKLIYATLKLAIQFLKYYSEFSASYMIWKPFISIINEIQVNEYPAIVRHEIDNLRHGIEKLSGKKLWKLMAMKKRPKLLRQYEPNIRPVIDGKSFRIISQEKMERNKLMHKYKKEMRGAIKEIRKDRSFIAGVKFAEQAKMDAERQAKVKQIYSWGQNQQSELKKFERKKRS